jgi:hypothetical protein
VIWFSVLRLPYTLGQFFLHPVPLVPRIIDVLLVMLKAKRPFGGPPAQNTRHYVGVTPRG